MPFSFVGSFEGDHANFRDQASLFARGRYRSPLLRSGERPSGEGEFLPTQTRVASRCCGCGLRLHFAPYRQSAPSAQLRHRIHRTRGAVRSAGTGSAVRPLTPLLVYAGSRLDRSDDRATLDGLKLPRLSPGFVYRRCPLGSFISRRPPGREGRGSDRCPSPPGFPRVPPAREVASLRRWDVLEFRSMSGMGEPLGERPSYALCNNGRVTKQAKVLRCGCICLHSRRGMSESARPKRADSVEEVGSRS
jgi:hypothetical protein